MDMRDKFYICDRLLENRAQRSTRQRKYTKKMFWWGPRCTRFCCRRLHLYVLEVKYNIKTEEWSQN